ncbi:hypothetical protein ADL22_00315 [Streptomyces sp. NRRL F-4489]|uniref:YidH family protein n=1 Tax=Streptomyces sp. NRRL F-4489 TaxID=1609095 RepID=UPI00074B1495|nr:DUF202 domain-containing protein [Streptomyces sp. NRRL F-4489]KUL55377.1 hypothetical protein ADL22_00315 [Streptomyces sp. NRRL F-4489]
MSSTRRRWPQAVYDGGTEPDPRFTLANERTFLAWMRTALSLLAAGVALRAVPFPSLGHRQVLAVLLVLSAAACAVTGLTRWARSERALRRAQPLPALSLAPVLSIGFVAAAAALLTALVV